MVTNVKGRGREKKYIPRFLVLLWVPAESLCILLCIPVAPRRCKLSTGLICFVGVRVPTCHTARNLASNVLVVRVRTMAPEIQNQGQIYYQTIYTILVHVCVIKEYHRNYTHSCSGFVGGGV